MQNRVWQFNVLEALPADATVNIRSCPESFCYWLVLEPAAAANGVVARPLRRLPGRALPPMFGQASAVLQPAEDPESEDDDCEQWTVI